MNSHNFDKRKVMEMLKIESCVDCGACKKRCPYELDIPRLLRKNLEDYKAILTGRVSI